MSEAVQLSNEMIAVLAILTVTVFLFVSEIVRVDVAAMLILVLLGLSRLIPGYDGLLAANHLFDGFSSNAVISIIAVMILGAGLDKSGLMSRLAGNILRKSGDSEKKIIIFVSTAVGLISSFMQNIGAAALFLPVVSRISRRSGFPLSHILMPMGYCAILGGTVTMIGSSPLILLNDLIANSNASLPTHIEPIRTFGLFFVTPIGLVLIACGIVYFVVLGPYLLPKVTGTAAEISSTLRYFREFYGIQGEIYEVRITDHSPLLGMTIDDLESRGHDLWIVATRIRQDTYISPPRETVFEPGADLAIMGHRHTVEQFAREYGLIMKPRMRTFRELLNRTSAGISEVVIPPDSSLVGSKIRDVHIRQRYNASVLAVFRIDTVIDTDLLDLQLQAGDTLVLHSTWKYLARIADDRNFTVVTDFPRDDSRPEKLPYALAFFSITLLLLIFTDLMLSVVLMTGAMGMVISGVIRIDEAYQSIGWQSVFMLACLIPLGLTVETTGTAAWLAQEFLRLIGNVPIWVLQIAIALLATIFTLVMSNIGATVLLVPLAINIAIGANADPAVFALIVALATSNSFLIPTHQVNALIMGPGGYRVRDFIRAGGIMTLLFLVVMLLMVNLVFYSHGI